MSRIKPASLRAIQTPDNLLEFLEDSLGWPLGSATFDDVTYEWSPEDAGVDPGRFPSLRSIRQLQPIVANQPWGIFFVEFEGSRLPVTPLRRMLTALVRKQRSAKDAPTWRLEDLLFVVTTRGESTIELHLMAFRESEAGPYDLRSIPWRPKQSPQRYLERLADELLPSLTWPDDPSDVDAWREHWQDAFKLRHGEVISTAASLADRMAQAAVALRDLLQATLLAEDGSGSLSTLLDEVRSELVADATADSFADMCAQTLVYGLLTARVNDPEGFGATPALAAAPFTNPFLEAFFEKVHDAAVAVDDNETVEQLVADLRASNVEVVLANFGNTAKGGDPVIHFYEEFLTKYDATEKKKAGAFYTPQAVVDFMVRGVDELLRTRFGLQLGVADPSTWAQVAQRNGFEIPDGIEPDSAFVSMIDPATGTGTYLVSWIRQARKSFCEQHPEEDWPAHLRRFVLPSMHAFELMLAPYAIAHLKVALELRNDGVDEAGLSIFLTDTLELRSGPPQFDILEDPIAAQGVAALRIKEEVPITVCIGNPPYLRTNRSAGGGWVVHPDGGGRSLFDDYLEPAVEHTAFGHTRSLFNLYTYFWRWAMWKTLGTERTEPGVIAFITASSWLTGPGFLGMRKFAREEASEIIVIDLGGEGLGSRREQNVFDIVTPVAIVFLIRNYPQNVGSLPTIKYRRVTGDRSNKLRELGALSIDSVDYSSVDGRGHGPLCFQSGGGEWDSFPALKDLIPLQQPGCKWAKTWPSATESSILADRWEMLLSSADASHRERCFVQGRTGRKITTVVKGGTSISDLPSDSEAPPIVRYGFRSFDRWWAFQDERISDGFRPSLWETLGPEQLFMVSSVTGTIGSGPAATVTPHVPDYHFFRGSYGGKDVFPAVLDSDGTPNGDPELLEMLSRAMDSEAAVSAKDLFAYCFGVLAGADYTSRFQEPLATPGPRIPVTADPELFAEMTAHGKYLLWLQTYGERFRNDECQDLAIPGSIRWRKHPTRIPADTKDFHFDADASTIVVADGRLDGVSADVWEFSVSGMQVVKKWLGYRTAKGTGKAVSSKSPLDHIRPTEWSEDWSQELRELVAVLTLTLELLPRGVELLDRILDGPLISADELPEPPPELRKPPTASNPVSEGLFAED